MLKFTIFLLFVGLCYGKDEVFNFLFGRPIDYDEFSDTSKNEIFSPISHDPPLDLDVVCFVQINCDLGTEVRNRLKECYKITGGNTTLFDYTNDNLCKEDTLDQYDTIMRNLRATSEYFRNYTYIDMSYYTSFSCVINLANSLRNGTCSDSLE